jgi:uncharacterized membrane protein YcaP (DUF421 family)
VDELLNPDPRALGLIVVRTLVVYLALFLLLRVTGKRQLGQLTPFDLVVLLIVSNAVQNAMVGSDTTLTGGLLAAATLVGANTALNRLLLRSPRLSGALVGQPSLLLHEGRFIDEHLAHEGLTREEVLQALREHGYDDPNGVKEAVLEVDGTISVIPASAPSTRTRRRMRGRKPTG